MAQRRYLFLAALILTLVLLSAATGGALAIARNPQAAAAPFGPLRMPGGSEGGTVTGGPTSNGRAISSDLPNKIYLPALTKQYSGILEDVQGTVSPTGADLKLNSGVTLSLPPGSVSAPVSVSFSRVVTDSTLTNANLTLFDVKTSGPVGSASIVVPLPPGARPDHLAAFYRPGDSQSVVPITGTVSAAGDAFTIPLVTSSGASAAQGLGRAVQGGIMSGTYGIEGDILYSYSKASYVMDIPYYEQDGENCWATVWLMFLKSYRPQTTEESIYKLLSLAKVEKNDGLLWFQEGTVAGLTKSVFGIDVEKNWWLSYNNFVDFVVKSVDEGRPVYVHMGKHQGLFLGYEIEDLGGPNETVSLVYHDPQNQPPQVAYRKVTAAQLKSEFWQYVAPFITLTGPPLSQAPSLQTIHLPDGTGGYGGFHGVAFGKARPGSVSGAILDKATWDHTASSGYRIQNNEVPRDFTDIILGDIPVWNMDRNRSVAVTVTSRVKGEFSSATHYSWETLYVTTTQATVAPSSRYKYGAVIPAGDLYDGLMQSSVYSDTSRFKITTELQSGGAFEVEFSHRPLYLKSIGDGYSNTGAELVLNGLGFGAAGGGTVTIGNVAATVLSWSNTQIKVKVPDDAVSGDVVVTVGEAKSNALPLMLWPLVSAVYPHPGYPYEVGWQVIITGTGFGPKAGQVYLSGSPNNYVPITASIDGWSSKEIVFTVPDVPVNGFYNIVIRLPSGAGVDWSSIWWRDTRNFRRPATTSNMVNVEDLWQPGYPQPAALASDVRLPFGLDRPAG